jgi:hypothetical protein
MPPTQVPRESPHAAAAGAPTEFGYWDNVEKPYWRRLRSAWKAVLGYDPAPAEDVVRIIGEMYFDADPLAEAFVEEVYVRNGSKAGRAMLDQALDDGVASIPDAPASLVALFADIEHDPPWLNHELVALGARTFRRYSTDVFRYAGAVTLMAYTENCVAKPLVLTGVYAGGNTRRRFLETAAFWIDVSEPGALEMRGAGRATALRVRVMHVFVRKGLSRHPEWNQKAWGVPISQTDALLALMGASVGSALAMRMLGYRTSAREVDAMMHFWRYVGHLMGVRPRWFPTTVREGVQLLFVSMVKSMNLAGVDGRRLSQSYAGAFAPDPGAPIARRIQDVVHDGVHRGFTRLFTPPWIYRQMQIAPAGLWVLRPLVQFPVVFAVETLRRRLRTVDGWTDRVARARRRRWLDYHLRDRAAEYRPVEAFTR